MQRASRSEADKNGSGEENFKIPSISSNHEPSRRIDLNGSVTTSINKIASSGHLGHPLIVSNDSGHNSDHLRAQNSGSGTQENKSTLIVIESRLEKLESAMDTFQQSLFTFQECLQNQYELQQQILA